METDYEYIIQYLSKRLQLFSFEHIIRHYMHKFRDEKIDVVLENRKSSGLNQRDNILTIAIAPNRDVNRNMLWDIFHEYGHLLDGKPNFELIMKQDKEYLDKREEKAWLNALIEIEKWPELIQYTKEVDEYIQKCMTSYKE